MQRMFADATPWNIPWMERVRVPVASLATAHPAQTVFTRFLPPPRPSDAYGTWKLYYEKWPMMTREILGHDMVDILPELRAVAPPAVVFDKATYSPWIDGSLHDYLRREKVTTLVVSGGETDVCVLAAIMGAVDLGYAIILLKDGICSTSDETHDATLQLYQRRFSTQLSVSTTAAVLDWWQP